MAATESLRKSLLVEVSKIDEKDSGHERKLARAHRKGLLFLFGATDAEKFVETMTFFLIAAHQIHLQSSSKCESKGEESETADCTTVPRLGKLAETFIAGLENATGGMLHARTISEIVKLKTHNFGVNYASVESCEDLYKENQWISIASSRTLISGE
eukprot:CAMPEP_0184495800 /NCGR_PEP_ID=MMETSP0113_2-20130426/32403_1 /TAXON_ID=91329 /ORGANISM="Norrisiella sphaerica, Strain BC52" /LENGTH=156 /DNA_ID=CAMNT_0026882159 /DNA_START=369 /DNA_END=839 /DNA_ORIENTATION=-